MQRDKLARTPMAFVDAIVQAYYRYGVNPDPALVEARIPPMSLQRPEARVSATQLESFSCRAMQELDDEALGWFSRKLPWGSYGMLCRASLTSPTLGIALKRWCRHHRLLTDDILFHMQVVGEVAVLQIEERVNLGALREFCLVSSLRYVHGYACWLIDSRLSLQHAEFPYSAPRHGDVYPLLFPGVIRFDSSRAGITFDARYLSLPMHRDEKSLQRMLQNALLLTVRQYRRDRLVAQRIRQLLLKKPSLDSDSTAIAIQLNVSTRTLQRQLDEEGTSFQRLKSEVQRERAIRLLGSRRYPIKQIATACGFLSEKSFSRAFRQWTGQSPSAYRDALTVG